MSVCRKPKSRQNAVAASATASGASLVRRCWNHVVGRWQRRKMIAALAGLDDRTLQDIGLCRGGIEAFVDGLGRDELRMRPVAPVPSRPAPEPPQADLCRAA